MTIYDMNGNAVVIIIGLVLGSFLTASTWYPIDSSFNCETMSEGVRNGCHTLKNSLHFLLFGVPPVALYSAIYVNNKK